VNVMSVVGIVSIVAATFIVSFAAGYLIRKYLAEARISSAEEAAKRIVADATREAERRKREALLEAKEEVHRLRADFESETRERRAELQRLDHRLMKKEEALDRKAEAIERREESVNSRQKELERRSEEVEGLRRKQVERLERISGLTREEARQTLLENLERELQSEMASLIREREAQAHEEAEKRARDIVASAVQRCAANHVSETSVSVVELPSDEMKGRIIGREGRNIRAFETLTGIDLIIDDTPEAVILSGFDPIRREVARGALEKLVADGRIHPARIEEMVEKSQKEMDARIQEEGEQAALETGVRGLHPELVKLLGRLRFRTSYGQNVLRHSIEVAHLAATMAAELGANANLAKRAGLLHDVGKAVDHEVEGSHVAIGVDLLTKYGESEDVVAAMESHHGDIEPRSVEAVLVAAADAASAARPGARRETLEAYLKRLRQLEDIADSFEGVEKTYAIQAGREIRILVKPEHVDDPGAARLAREVVKKVEDQLDYPGQIKVTVIRETRAVDYAK